MAFSACKTLRTFSQFICKASDFVVDKKLNLTKIGGIKWSEVVSSGPQWYVKRKSGEYPGKQWR
jgi:hypothetical protein